MMRRLILITIVLFWGNVFSVFAQTLTSPTYQIIDPSINSGGNANQSSSTFKLFETIGAFESGKFDSATYSIGSGVVNAITMNAPQITASQPGGGDPGTVCGGVGSIGDVAYGCFDKLKVTINADGNPTDTLYAVEVTESSDTNWANKKYIDFVTGTLTASLSTSTFDTRTNINAKTYSGLSYSVGGLIPTTTYKFRAFALQIANSASFPASGSYFDQSVYSQESTASTKQVGIALRIDIASDSTTLSSDPDSVDLGVISTTSVTTSPSNQGIWVKVSTNAGSGFTLNVKDDNTGLLNGIYSIGSANTNLDNTADLSVANTEGYGLTLRTGGNITNQGVGPSGITQTIASNYNNAGTAVVGKLTTNYVTLATTNKANTIIVSGYDLQARAKINTQAGTYTDVVHFSASGNF